MPVSKQPNCLGQPPNPYEAPRADNFAPPHPRKMHVPMAQVRLIRIAHSLRLLNLLVACFVALLFVMAIGGWLELNDRTTILDTLLIGGLVLSFVFIVCFSIPLMFFVFPAWVSILALVSLTIPGAWMITCPLTIFSVNGRARQILNENGMSVGVFGDAIYVAQPADGQPINLNPYGKIVDRGLTYTAIAGLIGYCIILSM